MIENNKAVLGEQNISWLIKLFNKIMRSKKISDKTRATYKIMQTIEGLNYEPYYEAMREDNLVKIKIRDVYH
ncbi:hypothetical protein Lal_00040197 [Lupinus albus]|nr:hypothetical protein Lal_00040197 [Lupinus albus]